MSQPRFHDTKVKKAQLQAALDELAELKEQLEIFESVVDRRLGTLLDQLAELRAEASELDEELRHIRERKLFGDDLIRYLDGAPKPARSSGMVDLHVEGLRKFHPPQVEGAQSFSLSGQIPDIRIVYRKLARRYHPDLARSEADRVVCNAQMAEINHAYKAGNLQTLMRIAGIDIPLPVFNQEAAIQFKDPTTTPPTEQEALESKLKRTRQQIDQLTRLPIVKLSLDVKLARHSNRDLLGEMAVELDYKIRRKMAERDYLRSQVSASVKNDDQAPASE